MQPVNGLPRRRPQHDPVGGHRTGSRSSPAAPRPSMARTPSPASSTSSSKKNFEGVSVNAQSGCQRATATASEITVNGLLGASFADGRGSVMLGADYSKRDIIFGKDRDWVSGLERSGTTTAAWQLEPVAVDRASLRRTNAGPGRLAGATPPGYPLRRYDYASIRTASLRSRTARWTPLIRIPVRCGVGFNYQVNPDALARFIDPEHTYLQLPLERYSLFGSGPHRAHGQGRSVRGAELLRDLSDAPGFTSGVFNVWSPTIPYIRAYDDPASPSFGQPPPAPSRRRSGCRAADLANLLNSRPRLDETRRGPMQAAWITSAISRPIRRAMSTRSSAACGVTSPSATTTGTGRCTPRTAVRTVNAYQPEGFPFLPRLQNLFNATQYGENFDISSLPGFSPVAVTGHCTSGLPIFNPTAASNNTPSVSQDCSDYVVLRMNDCHDARAEHHRRHGDGHDR